MHQAGTSVLAAGSSASTSMAWPIGTSPIRSASMMIGIGHFLPSASIVTEGAGAEAGVGAVAPAGGGGGATRLPPVRGESAGAGQCVVRHAPCDMHHAQPG